MKKTRNLIIIIIAIVAIIGITIFASHGHEGKVSVSVSPVHAIRFQVKLPETGIVQHPHIQVIPALVAGNLSGIFVRAGDYVTQGQVLATIFNPQTIDNLAGSNASYQSSVAAVQQAQTFQENSAISTGAQVATSLSSLNEARRQYLANLSLFQNKAISRDTLDQSKAKLDQAQVAYTQALQQRKINAIAVGGQSSAAVTKANLDKSASDLKLATTQVSNLNILAPFTGQIQTVTAQTSDALRPLQVGDAVTQGQTVFTIAATNEFIVKAQVDEQDISQVHLGQPAEISGEDFNGTAFPGHVALIAPTAEKSTDANSTTRQVVTTIAFDKTSSILKDGMTADVDIITTDIPNALVVPNSAVQPRAGSKYVWTVVNGKLHKVTVTTGPINDTVTVIRSGLSLGDRVVEQPISIFVEGTPVTLATPSPQST